MAEHYTCDKCGMPMESQRTTEIDGKEYEMCTTCKTAIMGNLDGKGRNSDECHKFSHKSFRFQELAEY